MKSKTIKAILRAKTNAWLETVPEASGLREALASNIIVTGGCIVSMLTGEKVNDYDIYFRTREAALLAAQHYVGLFNASSAVRFAGNGEDAKDVEIRVDDNVETGRVRIIVKSAGIAAEGVTDDYKYFEAAPDEQGEEYVSRSMRNVTNADEVTTSPAATDDDGLPPYRPIFLSGNAITLANGVQLIIRFFGEPEEIHANYDFIHCTSYWTSWDGALVLPAAALEAIITKELRYVGSKYPLCSLIRIRKFTARGWTVNAGQILKMVFQLQSFDLTNIEVLEDQLTGVDAAYFSQIIDRLKAKQAEELLEGNEPNPIDTAYLMTIIDRLF